MGLPADQDAGMPEADAGLAGVVERLGAGKQGQRGSGRDEAALRIDHNRTYARCAAGDEHHGRLEAGIACE